MSKGDIAKNLFDNGYNCSQAVLCAFSDETGLDSKTAYKLASSFGGGISRLREVCGAVSGMCMAAGIIYGYDEEHEPEQKPVHYARIQELVNKFKEENGSFLCRDLLEGYTEVSSSPTPEERTDSYYKRRPCGEYVKCAAQILEKYIEEHK